MALSLVSSQPITVTYNGDLNPELWDVDICLSSVLPQQQGNMTINHTYPEGGTFTAVLPVMPRLIFTRQSDAQIRVLDPLPAPIVFNTADGCWVHNDPGFTLIKSPGGLSVDDDCDGTPDVPVRASSNFFPGICGNPEPSCATPR